MAACGTTFLYLTLTTLDFFAIINSDLIKRTTGSQFSRRGKNRFDDMRLRPDATATRVAPFLLLNADCVPRPGSQAATLQKAGHFLNLPLGVIFRTLR
jgi:hypothetical protein